MDDSLYDEFGNYIGPDLEDEEDEQLEEEEEEEEEQLDEAMEASPVRAASEPTSDREEEDHIPSNALMQIDGTMPTEKDSPQD